MSYLYVLASKRCISLSAKLAPSGRFLSSRATSGCNGVCKRCAGVHLSLLPSVFICVRARQVVFVGFDPHDCSLSHVRLGVGAVAAATFGAQTVLLFSQVPGRIERHCKADDRSGRGYSARCRAGSKDTAQVLQGCSHPSSLLSPRPALRLLRLNIESLCGAQGAKGRRV